MVGLAVLPLNNMNHNIIIDDSLIDLETQTYIKDLLTAEYFPWFLGYEKTTTTHSDWTNHFTKVTSNIFEYSQFVHLFVHNGQQNSDYADAVANIFVKVIEKYNFDDKIIRIKSNYCTKVNCINNDAHQSPHIDIPNDHWVMLYYVNDSDGDTFIFDQKIEGSTSVDSIQSLTVKKRISPKQGRIAIFDGAHLHAGMHPTKNDSRIVINYAFPK